MIRTPQASPQLGPRHNFWNEIFSPSISIKYIYLCTVGFGFSNAYLSHYILTVDGEQDRPPPISLGNQADIPGRGNDNTVRPVNPVNNQDTPLVTEGTLDPVDIIMHDGPNEADMDLLSRIHGLYRLLDLISEQGSRRTGAMIASSMTQGYSLYLPSKVDKIIISQESMEKLVNDICPGAYTSMTKVGEAMSRSTHIISNVSVP